MNSNSYIVLIAVHDTTDMIKRIGLLFLFITLVTSAGAQQYTLSGFVRDSTSGEALPGASIRVLNLAAGVNSNSYGFYSLSLPAGEYAVVFSYVGYASRTLKISLDAGITRNIELAPQYYQAREIVISAIKEKDQQIKSTDLSKVDLPVNTAKKLPSLMGEVDILKTLQLMPGVQAAGEGNAGFFVRGGAPDQNLILLDEAPVYNTGHLFGFFSVFNADAIRNATLIKGGMPANYGGRLSSVVDVNMKEGNNKQLHGEGGIGFIASRLSVQGPIQKNKSSFIISARRTYIDLITKPFINNTDYKGSGYFFYDLNAKVNFKLSEKDHVYLSAYTGKDVFSFHNGDRSFDIKIPWGNTTATLRWNHVFNSKLFLNTSVIYNKYKFQVSALQNYFDVRLTSGITDGNVKADMDYYLNNRHHIKFGANYIYHTFSPSTISGAQDSVALTPENAVRKYAHETGIYVMDEWDVSPKLRLNIGLRHSGFMQIGPYTRYFMDAAGNKQDSVVYGRGQAVGSYSGLEPRFIFRYSWDNEQSVKGGVTRHYQFIHLVSNAGTTLPTDVWVPSTYLVKPQIAWQYTAGYFRNFKENEYEASVSVYYKDMKQQIEYREGYTPSLNDPEIDFIYGNGQAYGMELLLNKQEGRLSGWIGYTLGWTWRKFPGLNDGRRYPAKYDRRHDLSVVASYEYNKRWTFSGTFIFGTGNVTTLPETFYFMEGTMIQEYSKINSYRMAPYHRVDLAAVYRPKVKKPRRYTGSWTFSVYNVYNRKNPYFIYFDQEGDGDGGIEMKAKQVSLFPVLPSVTYNFSF